MKTIYAGVCCEPGSTYRWESEKGKNLTFSLVLNPLITAFTTMSVATPSITLTMQMNAR